MLQCCDHCGNWQLGTGSLIAAQALTSLWRWQDLICLAHNLSKSPTTPRPAPGKCRVTVAMTVGAYAHRLVACSMLPDTGCAQAQLCCLLPAGAWLQVVMCCRLGSSKAPSALTCCSRLLPILMAASIVSIAMSLFDVGRLSFNLTGLWFGCFNFGMGVPVSRDRKKTKRLLVGFISRQAHALTSSCNSVCTPLPPSVSAVYPLCIHNPFIQAWHKPSKLTWVAQLDKIASLEPKKSA